MILPVSQIWYVWLCSTRRPSARTVDCGISSVCGNVLQATNSILIFHPFIFVLFWLKDSSTLTRIVSFRRGRKQKGRALEPKVPEQSQWHADIANERVNLGPMAHWIVFEEKKIARNVLKYDSGCWVACGHWTFHLPFRWLPGWDKGCHKHELGGGGGGMPCRGKMFNRHWHPNKYTSENTWDIPHLFSPWPIFTVLFLSGCTKGTLREPRSWNVWTTALCGESRLEYVLTHSCLLGYGLSD